MRLPRGTIRLPAFTLTGRRPRFNDRNFSNVSCCPDTLCSRRVHRTGRHALAQVRERSVIAQLRFPEALKVMPHSM